MNSTISSHRLTIASALAAAILLAACGSAGKPESAGGQPTSAQLRQDQRDAVRFSDCMRSHGVPDFPDPPTAADPSAGHAFKDAIAGGSPAIESAEGACQHLMPGGQIRGRTTAPSPAHTAALIALAHCLRSHGFPNFPDPDSAGELTQEMVANAGINLHQPAVVQAADACVGVTDGVITRGTVARFLADH